MNYFQELILKRESCRKFNEKPVSKKDLETIIEAARLAPSACNGQPWHFIAVTNDELKKSLSSHMQPFNAKAGAFIVIIQEKTNITSSIGGKIKHQDYAQMDIGIVTSYLSLAATSLGISNCILGWFDESKVKETLKIPKKKRVRLILSLGYTDDKDVRTKLRKDISEIVDYID
ncbi:MAG: nitroreductase family protein [Tenericutes bacterium]|nr:nitroreductase family protein [Mycoplasmatota bacterium]